MTLLRRYTILSFALVLLSIVGVCIAQRSVTLLVVAGVLAALSWYITEGPRGRFLPKWVSNILVLTVTLSIVPEVVLQEQATHQDVISALGRFAVWMTLIKLYEPKTARDQGQLLVLSVLLMLIGCLLSTDLLFGAVMILYIALGVYVVLLYQLFASNELAREERRQAAPQDYRLVPSMRPVVGRRFGVQFRLFSAGVGICGLVLAVGVFLIFPRGFGKDTIPQLGSLSGERQAGFLDRVSLTSGTRITDSRRQALFLSVRDRAGEPVRNLEPVYLRGAVLESYNGAGEWAALDLPKRVVEPEARVFTSLGMSLLPVADEITVEVQPLDKSPVIFNVYAPSGIAMRSLGKVEYTPATQILEHSEPRREGYTIRCRPNPDPETLNALTGGAFIDPIPHQKLADPRIAQLARRLLRRAGISEDPPDASVRRYRWYRAASAIFEAFLESPEFEYTLDLSDQVQKIEDGRPMDPTVQFLLDSKRGHCEYFASAFVSLCHNVDIPARLVIGYLAYEYDERTDRYVVLDSNAHAWVEVRTGPYEWSTFDPTPPAALDAIHGQDATLTDTLRRFYERFDSAWSGTVVEYDSSRQDELASRVDLNWSERFSNMVASVREFAGDVNRFFRLGPAGYIWMGIVGLALVIAVIALVKLMRRSIAIRRLFRLRHFHGRQYQRLLRQLGFYLDLLDVLDRGGVAKPHWQPPLLYASALPDDQAELRSRVRRVTELFYAARYGEEALTREQLAEAKQLVREVAAEVRVRMRF